MENKKSLTKYLQNWSFVSDTSRLSAQAWKFMTGSLTWSRAASSLHTSFLSLLDILAALERLRRTSRWTCSSSNWTFCSCVQDRKLIKCHLAIRLIQSSCVETANSMQERKKTKKMGFDIKFNWRCCVWRVRAPLRCSELIILCTGWGTMTDFTPIKGCTLFSTPLYWDWNYQQTLMSFSQTLFCSLSLWQTLHLFFIFFPKW